MICLILVTFWILIGFFISINPYFQGWFTGTVLGLSYNNSVYQQTFVELEPKMYVLVLKLDESMEAPTSKVTPVPSSILCLKVTYWLCFTSGHPMDSRPFHSMTIGPPIPEIQSDLENSRSKVKVEGTLVSVASSWPIFFLFHINWTNHSWDTANRMFDWGKMDFKFYVKNC